MSKIIPFAEHRLLLVAAVSLLLGLSLSTVRIAHGQKQSSLPLMPQPAEAKIGTGEFIINNGFGVVFQGYQEPRLDRAKTRFLAALSRETGIPLVQESALNKANFFIETKGPSAPVQQLGEDESYHLEITPSRVHLAAANPLGILHGLQTFLQLVQITPNGFSVPVVAIDDQPRFPWRGLMIDVGRHFMPLDVIRRNLDGMEAVKLNVFHWHLSDDQGFRVESKQFPFLHEKGSDGLYYTQEEIQGIIAYARDRGIRVIPEFDMPGHASSWFVGYPDLASGTGPYEIQRHWGVFDPAMDPARDSTYIFLDKFIGEMTALFPDAYFHIGGDECNGKEWDRNPRIQAFMKEHGLKDNAALQAYFTTRVQKLVVAHGKTVEGWDEVLQPETPKDVVIQSWRGTASLAEAAHRGYQGLLSNGYYIDLNQPAAEHYAADPLGKEAAALTPEEKKRILGGEATMWSEFVTPENIDSRIWPRTAAIAERLWSPQSVQDVDSMYVRLAQVSQKLQYFGLEHNSSYPAMLRRMTGNPDPASLKVLGDVVQPPKGYAREELREYDVFTPLNRLADAVPPESATARQFGSLANSIASGKATARDWQEAQQWLQLWRDNDAQLQPTLPQSQLTQELVPVSANLRHVAEIGLAALDCLHNHRPATAQWREEQLALLKKAEQPQAILVNMVVPGVVQLVQATGKQ